MRRVQVSSSVDPSVCQLQRSDSLRGTGYHIYARYRCEGETQVRDVQLNDLYAGGQGLCIALTAGFHADMLLSGEQLRREAHHSDRGKPKLTIPCASKWRVMSVTAVDQLAQTERALLTRDAIMLYIDDIERLRVRRL
jgi:hypothetical protein